MPQPNVNNVHIDAILTNISVAYLQNTANFIADKVFPVIPVDKKSDLYFKYTKEDWFRDEAQRRAVLPPERLRDGLGAESRTRKHARLPQGQTWPAPPRLRRAAQHHSCRRPTAPWSRPTARSSKCARA